MNKTILGECLMPFVREGDLLGTSSNNMIALGLATSCAFNLNVDEIDITSKDSGSWKDSIPGRKSWDMSTDNLYCEHYDKLMALAINRTPIKLHWFPSQNVEANNEVSHTPTTNNQGETLKGYEGMAFINSVSANANNNEAASYSAAFTGKGAIVPTTTVPGGGLGLSTPMITVTKGSSNTIMAVNPAGQITASITATGVSATVANGIITVSASASASPGAYVLTISDGTSTIYAMVTVVAAA